MGKRSPDSVKILVAEDSTELAALLLSQLEKLGYTQVQVTNNGQDAYNSCIKKFSEGVAFDLVLADFKMPKMTGLDLLRKVRHNELISDTKFILMTGFGETQIIREFMALKMDDMISKPFEMPVLEKKIEGVLAKMKRKR